MVHLVDKYRFRLGVVFDKKSSPLHVAEFVSNRLLFFHESSKLSFVVDTGFSAQQLIALLIQFLDRHFLEPVSTKGLYDLRSVTTELGNFSENLFPEILGVEALHANKRDDIGVVCLVIVEPECIHPA